MTSISTLHGIGAALAIGGFAAGTALFGAGAAYADPMGDLEPLLSSSCSFAQIDSALHQVAPDTAAQLDAAPGQKAALKNAYDQPHGSAAGLLPAVDRRTAANGCHRDRQSGFRRQDEPGGRHLPPVLS